MPKATWWEIILHHTDIPNPQFAGCDQADATWQIFEGWLSTSQTNATRTVWPATDKLPVMQQWVGWYTDDKSGRASMGWPIRKCLGVKEPRLSSESGRGHKGLEFNCASPWTRTVVSSKLSLFSSSTFRKCCFMDYSFLPEPAKMWTHSGIYFQAMVRVEQKSRMSRSYFASWRITNKALSSLAAPTKLVPLSL